jgi:ribosome-associated protein
MHDTHETDDLEEEYTGPSKSSVKRQMIALQEIGEALTRLTEKQMANVPIEDERLLIAVKETHNITSNSARKRHLQYIGKLMRDVDTEAIERSLQVMYRQKKESNNAFHELEKLRDSVLEQGLGGIEQILTRWPSADRQQLRQLVLAHQREIKNNKPPAASRKLFKALRELQEESPEKT